MRAIVVDRWMEPGDLRVGSAPVKPPFPFIPGGEVGGVVSEVGEDVEGFALGDRVCATTGLGGYAERVVVSPRGTWKIPDAMSFAEAAAFPVVYPTSYAALVYRAHLAPGETLLVHAAAGGVGSAAVQIGRALGARVLATAGGADKLEVAREAGAELAIDYRAGDFVEPVLDATEGRGADVIYDPVGGEVFDRSLKCIAWNGRLLVIGFAGGTIPSVRANRILLKNVAVVGLHWGAYAQHEPERIPETFRALFDLYEQGRIRPRIDAVRPLAEASKALVELAGRRTVGKLVLEP